MVEEQVVAKGVFRVQLLENGEIVGDSGWCENQITNLGARYYLVETLGGSSGSLRVNYMGIGSGGAPAAADTSLSGEISTGTQGRGAVNFTISDSRTAVFTYQFASSQYSTRGASSTINNLGLFAATSGGTVFAGNTFTSSSWNTNQDVNATYQVRF